MFFMLVPNTFHLFVKCWSELVSISIGVNDTFKRFWVGLNLNRFLRISEQVVVQFESSWLFISFNDISDLKEEI